MKQIEKINHDYDTTSQVADLTDKLNEAIDLINEQQAEIERLKQLKSHWHEWGAVAYPSTEEQH